MRRNRYYSFRDHLFERFGEKVHRIPVNAGFTCPNRNGMKGSGGCIYCDAAGSGAAWIHSGLSISQQLLTGMDLIRRRFNVNKFIAYFQPFSNTYAPVDHLRSLYLEALRVPDIIGLSIGTRPDVVPNTVLDMIQEIAEDTYVWIEYGLQSIHRRTLERINRGHSYEEFEDAVFRTQNRSILTAVHIILGLPDETREDMLDTVKQVAQLPLQGIKIHHLYILKDTPIEKLYLSGGVRLLEEDEYVQLAADAIEQLPPAMVIHRLMGNACAEHLISPAWSLRKSKVIQEINMELERRGSFQGYTYSNLKKSADAAPPMKGAADKKFKILS